MNLFSNHSVSVLKTTCLVGMAAEPFRLTADGRAYKRGKRIYANKDIYEVGYMLDFIL